jgi:hypothetical protein
MGVRCSYVPDQTGVFIGARTLKIEKILFWKTSIRWSAPTVALFVARNMRAQRIHALLPTMKRPCPYCCSCCNSTDRKIRGREDGIVFDVFVVCRNIFHKTKYREKTFESHACLISIFLFKGALFVNLELKAILRAIRGKNRPQDRIE